MSTTPSWTVRSASPADLEAIAGLIDLFVADHPAAHHPRPLPVLHDVLFGPRALLRAIVAEQGSRLVGYTAWNRIFDSFWAMHGGEINGLFVHPDVRGRGIAAALVAAACADVRDQGGVYLHATYGVAVAPFYERVAVGHPVRECHLSARAFTRVADLAGKRPREIVAGLPDPALNRAAPLDPPRP